MDAAGTTYDATPGGHPAGDPEATEVVEMLVELVELIAPDAPAAPASD